VKVSTAGPEKGDWIIPRGTLPFSSPPLLSHPSVLLLISFELVIMCCLFFVFCFKCCSPFFFAGLKSITMADSFDCANCKESLYGRKYIQSDDSPYCIPCYDSRFSNTCDECKELIAHDARVRHLFFDMIRPAIIYLLLNSPMWSLYTIPIATPDVLDLI